MAQYPELALLSDLELRPVLLRRDLKPLFDLLDALYRDTIFWYSPYWCYATVNERIAEFNRSPDESRKQEYLVRGGCLLEEHKWLMSTQPELGQERPLRRVHLEPRRDILFQWFVEELTDGSACIPQWPSMGCWQLTAFPQAVTWLTDWVRDAKRDIAALEAEYYPQAPQLRERADTLKNTYLKQVHRKEFLGEIPEQRVTTIHRTRYDEIEYRGRKKTVEKNYDQDLREQWYDPVEELDQTHADRRLELANELTQLARFTAYCRTSAG